MNKKELRELCEKATPGPWRHETGDYDKGRGHIMTAAPVTESWTKSPLLCSHLFGPDDEANLALMATARTALPALLDECDALMKALVEMRDIARHFANVAGHADDAVAIAVNKRADEIISELRSHLDER